MTPAAASSLVKTSGRSMLPLIRHGSMVSLQDVAPEEIHAGDIAALTIDGELRLHRILAVDSRHGKLRFREKGDNELFSRWVPAGQYRGRAAWIFTRSGRRPLAADPALFRLRLVTLLSRLEADFFEFLRRLPGGGRGRPLAGGRLAVRLFRLLLAPIRVFLSPLLFSIYRAGVKDDGTEEYRLLLWILREAYPAGEGGREKPPTAVIDPHLFLHSASAQGVAAVAADILASGAFLRREGDAIRDDLRLLVHRTALQNIEARRTVADVAEVFETAGIDYAILKGPALSATLYTSRPLRPVSDIDVLIRRRDRGKALEVLEEKGYLRKARGLAGRILLWGHFHSALKPPGKGRLPVELHWAPVDRVNLYRLPEEDFFKRLVKVRDGDRTFSTLSAEDTLLYLCLHVAKHGLLNKQGLEEARPPEWFCRGEAGNRLIWFLDIELLLRRKGDVMDWGEIRARADSWNIADDVAVTLGVLDKILPLSEAARCRRRLGLPEREGGGGRGGALRRISDPLLRRAMAMDERFAFRPARFFFVGKLFFPPRDVLRRYYGRHGPRRRFFLCLAHPALMAARLLGLSRSRADER